MTGVGLGRSCSRRFLIENVVPMVRSSVLGTKEYFVPKAEESVGIMCAAPQGTK
jgi:hypothetical protein